MKLLKKTKANVPFIDKIGCFLLVAFIIISPIYKNISFISVVGLNPLTIVALALIVYYLLKMPSFLLRKKDFLFSFPLFVVFVLEIVFNGDFGFLTSIFGILLFILFLQTEIRINLKTIFVALVISSIVSAFFSIYHGISSGLSSRNAAVYVDGSIAPLTIAVVLFSKNIALKRKTLLSFLAIISSLFVVLFGASRARIIIVLIIFASFFIYSFFSEKDGFFRKNSALVLIAFFVGVITIAVFSQTDLGKNIFSLVFSRFSDGLSSSGRDDELVFAKSIVEGKWLFGAGWRRFAFYNSEGSYVAYDNHNSYMALFSRGGLFIVLFFLLSLGAILKYGFKYFKKQPLILVLTFLLLLLSYGNAGIFNYTISSIGVIITILIRKEKNSYESLIRLKTSHRFATTSNITA